MIGVADPDPWLWFAAIALIAWCVAVTAVTLVVVLIGKWALARADRRDIPRIIGALANLVGTASWPAELTAGLRALDRYREPLPRADTGTTEQGAQPVDGGGPA